MSARRSFSPNQTMRIEEPVSLLDIYPTLVEVCNIDMPASHNLDGLSILSMLKGQKSKRGAPVISTHGKDNHAVITKDFH